MSFDSIGDRMKTNYENISRFYLTRRTPVIIRLDGRSFHTFTHFFKKPFDNLFMKTMEIRECSTKRKTVSHKLWK